MISRQRTRAVTCRTSSARIVAGSRTGSAVTLAISGTAGGTSSTSAIAPRQPLGRRRHQRAMERGRDLQQDAAPRPTLLGQRDGALDRVRAARDHLLAFAIVVGELADAALDAASAATASTVATSAPRMAAMAPSPAGTASCMAWPRSRSRRAASPIRSAPAAARAEYSPRLWPAT